MPSNVFCQVIRPFFKPSPVKTWQTAQSPIDHFDVAISYSALVWSGFSCDVTQRFAFKP
jgi:hypothetical protein